MSSGQQFSASGRFPPTSWTTVRNAVHLRQSADRLLRKYWKPVYWFIRRSGYAHEDAEDLTQGFFLYFVDNEVASRADPTRGRFRNFLLKVLKRYLADQRTGRCPMQHVFERRMTSISTLLDAEERTYDPPQDETPDIVFLKHWAVALWQYVLEETRQQCAGEDRATWFDVFLAAIEAPPTQSTTHPAIAKTFQLTVDQVRYRIEQVRRRCHRLLRSEVRRTGCPEPELDDEIQEIIGLLHAQLGSGAREL